MALRCSSHAMASATRRERGPRRPSAPGPAHHATAVAGEGGQGKGPAEREGGPAHGGEGGAGWRGGGSQGEAEAPGVVRGGGRCGAWRRSAAASAAGRARRRVLRGARGGGRCGAREGGALWRRERSRRSCRRAGAALQGPADLAAAVQGGGGGGGGGAGRRGGELRPAPARCASKLRARRRRPATPRHPAPLRSSVRAASSRPSLVVLPRVQEVRRWWIREEGPACGCRRGEGGRRGGEEHGRC